VRWDNYPEFDTYACGADCSLAPPSFTPTITGRKVHPVVKRGFLFVGIKKSHWKKNHCNLYFSHTFLTSRWKCTAKKVHVYYQSAFFTEEWTISFFLQSVTGRHISRKWQHTYCHFDTDIDLVMTFRGHVEVNEPQFKDLQTFIHDVFASWQFRCLGC